MEEKKTAKQVELNATAKQKNEEKQQKLSYEQLNEVCAQLYQENQKLRNALDSVNHANMFKRLDYLFEVVHYSDKFDSGFLKICTDEIVAALTIPEPKGESKESAEE